MSRLEHPVRWGGLAALAAGVLLFIAELLRLYAGFDPTAFVNFFVVDGWLGALLAVIMLLGLVGIYVPEARALGPMGLVGFCLAIAGVQLAMGASFVFAFIRPDVLPWKGEEYIEDGPQGLVFALSFVLGWVLLGIAILRARVYPRLAGALLLAGALIIVLPLPLSGVIFAGAVAWIGYILFESEGQQTPSPAHA